MGIYNNNIVVYGIQFSYEEALVVLEHSDYKEIVEECLEKPEHPDHLLHFWGGEFSSCDEYNREVGCRAVSPYFDPPSKDNEYYLGVNLTNADIQYLKNFDTESVHKEIIEFCKKYNLPYSNKEFKMYYRVDVG